MKTRTFTDRQSEKTALGLLSTYLKESYKLPPKAAETLCSDIVVLRTLFNQNTREDGQIIYHVVKIGESPAKSLKECQFLPVRLTLFKTKDLEIRHQYGLSFLTLEIMKRLAYEAFNQGALLTLEDLCVLLRISERTVKRYKKRLEGQGVFLPLRGYYTDMGPSTSHKDAIISLSLLGYSETEIAQRVHHSLERVEAYLKDFVRVALMIEDKYHISEIIRITKLSKGLVFKYSTLYKKYASNPLLSDSLRKKLALFKLQKAIKKGAKE